MNALILAAILAPVFTDNIVLQRDQPVPVWGTAKPGEQVTVQFAGQTKTTTTDTSGKWLITLDPMPGSTTARNPSAKTCWSG